MASTTEQLSQYIPGDLYQQAQSAASGSLNLPAAEDKVREIVRENCEGDVPRSGGDIQKVGANGP